VGKSEDLIFLSYSRKDAEFVRKLYLALRQDGFKLWFDEEDLLPGQKWQQAIREALSNVRAVLLCLSTKWVDKRGYVQKELKIALDVLQEFPEGDIYLIPIRLDDCAVPNSLANIQYLDVWSEEDFAPLKRALAKIVRATEGEESAGGEAGFIKLASASRYGFFLTGWDTTGEQAIKLKFDQLNESVDFINNKDYAAVLKLWADIEGFEEFDLRHGAWDKEPILRLPLLLARSHLLFARIQLINEEDFQMNVPKIYKLIQEVIEFGPSEIDTQIGGHFSPETMEVQNQNYRDLLFLVREWFRGWSPFVLEGLFQIPQDESEKLSARVNVKLSEVERILHGD
jgi:TIR domain-containing protein